MRCIILAGGQGQRAKKRYPNMPKALIHVSGEPIVGHLIKNLRRSGLFDQILLNVRLQDEKFFHDFRVPLLLEKKPCGNAGALKRFKRYLSDPFLVHHCDVFSNVDYRRLFKAFEKSKACGIMTLVTPKKFGDFGVPQLRSNRIVGFKREKEVRKTVNGGIYYFRKEVISLIGDGFQDLDRDLFPKLIERNELAYYIHEGSWMDIGT